MNETNFITDLISINNINPSPFDNIVPANFCEYKRTYIDPFLTGEVFYNNSEANLEQVVGFRSYAYIDPQYYELTWKNLLQGGLKRVSYNLDKLQKNPEYYVNNEEKENYVLIKHNNFYFVAEGNNRTVIAKYFYYYNKLPPILKNIRIMEYLTDYIMLNAWLSINNFLSKYYKNVVAKAFLHPELKQTIIKIINKDIEHKNGFIGLLISRDNYLLLLDYFGKINDQREKYTFEDCFIENVLKKIDLMKQSPSYYTFGMPCVNYNILKYYFRHEERSLIERIFNECSWLVFPSYSAINKISFLDKLIHRIGIF